MESDILKIFSVSEISFSKDYLNCYQILHLLIFIFGLARLTQVCNLSPDSESSLKVMRTLEFSQESKWKQKSFTNNEKQVGNFLKTGTIMYYSYRLRYFF